MEKYLVSDFSNGEEIFHLTNPRLKMVVIDRNESDKVVICRWVDSLGKSNKESYFPSELEKFSAKEEVIIVSSKPKRNNSW